MRRGQKTKNNVQIKIEREAKKEREGELSFLLFTSINRIIGRQRAERSCGRDCIGRGG